MHASQRALGENWNITPQLGHRHQLVRSGPYRWIRHPIYTALFLVQGSSFLVTSNWVVGAACLGATLLDVLRRTRTEESLLQARFGTEYERYCTVTGRFFPRFESIRPS